MKAINLLAPLALGLLLSGCNTMMFGAPAGAATGEFDSGTEASETFVSQSGELDENGIPEPIFGNEGRYMCPYTEDGVAARWVDKSLNAKVGSAIGTAAGRYAGQKALELIPFIGGWLGGKAGDAAGRKIAI